MKWLKNRIKSEIAWLNDNWHIIVANIVFGGLFLFGLYCFWLCLAR